MGGWLFHHTYVTVRSRVYRFARRSSIRCLNEIRETGTVNWQRAQRFMSYFGRLDGCDSEGVKRQYSIMKTHRLGGYTIAHHERMRKHAGKNSGGDRTAGG